MLAVETVLNNFVGLQCGNDREQNAETDRDQAYGHHGLSLSLQYLKFNNTIRRWWLMDMLHMEVLCTS